MRFPRWLTFKDFFKDFLKILLKIDLRVLDDGRKIDFTPFFLQLFLKHEKSSSFEISTIINFLTINDNSKTCFEEIRMTRYKNKFLHSSLNLFTQKETVGLFCWFEMDNTITTEMLTDLGACPKTLAQHNNPIFTRIDF